MTTYYVRVSGNDANAGTSAGAAKLTIQAAVTLATTAGDIVYVGAGTYREMVTVAASGSVGNVISIIGDYDGAQTGDAGVVRITGAANETTIGTRASCIVVSSRNYITIRGFLFDGTSGTGTTGGCIHGNAAGTNVTIDKCVFCIDTASGNGVNIVGASQAAWTIQNCVFIGRSVTAFAIYPQHSSGVSNVGHVIQNTLSIGGGRFMLVQRVGGITVKNATISMHSNSGVQVSPALTAGQTVTVNNSIIYACTAGLAAATVGEIVEDYNSVIGCTTARSNVTAGANSVAYPPGLDMRPYVEALNGGTLVLPLASLASYSGLVEYSAGTGAPSTDWRGHAVAGSLREWGAEEYVSTYGIEAGGGVTMWPLSNGFIQAIIGGGV